MILRPSVVKKRCLVFVVIFMSTTWTCYSSAYSVPTRTLSDAARMRVGIGEDEAVSNRLDRQSSRHQQNYGSSLNDGEENRFSGVSNSRVMKTMNPTAMKRHASPLDIPPKDHMENRKDNPWSHHDSNQDDDAHELHRRKPEQRLGGVAGRPETPIEGFLRHLCFARALVQTAERVSNFLSNFNIGNRKRKRRKSSSFS